MKRRGGLDELSVGDLERVVGGNDETVCWTETVNGVGWFHMQQPAGHSFGAHQEYRYNSRRIGAPFESFSSVTSIPPPGHASAEKCQTSGQPLVS